MGADSSPAMARLLDAATAMNEIARTHAPDGNLEVAEGYRMMPEVMSQVQGALNAFHKSAQDQGLHPAVVDYIEAWSKAGAAMVAAAEAIHPAIEKLHRVELEYLRAGGSQRWDRSVNSGGGATPAAPPRARRTRSAPSPGAAAA